MHTAGIPFERGGVVFSEIFLQKKAGQDSLSGTLQKSENAHVIYCNELSKL